MAQQGEKAEAVKARSARGAELGQSLGDAAITREDRLYHEFAVPESLRRACGNVVVLGIVELKVQEEMWATKRSNNDPVQLATNLAVESLRFIGRQVGEEADGSPKVERVRLSTADGTAEKAFHEMRPQLRQLVVGAYSAVHQPPQDAAAAFLNSRRAVAL